MSQAHRHPSADRLLAIAQAAEDFARVLPHAVRLWDAKPEENPPGILLGRHANDSTAHTDSETIEHLIAFPEDIERAGVIWRRVFSDDSENVKYADSGWDDEYLSELRDRALAMLESLKRLHELLAEVWVPYLGNWDDDSWPLEKVKLMPSTAVTDWPVEVLWSLRDLQRDLRIIEGALDLGNFTAPWAKEVLSITRVKGLQASSRQLKRNAESVGETEPETRDAWIYKQAMDGKPWKWILSNIMATCADWDPVTTDGGVRFIAKSYAKKNGLAKVPNRRPGRPRNTK